MKKEKVIIHATVTLDGGVGTVIKNLIRNQLNNGYSIGIIYPSNINYDKEKMLNELNGKVKLFPVEIHKISGFVQIMGLPIKKTINKLNNNKQDIIIHAHNPASIGYLRDIKDVPILCTIHGKNTQSSKVSHFITKLILRKLIENNSKIVGVSKSVSKYYNSILDTNSIDTVYNGVDINKEKITSKEKEFTIGFVASLNDLKGWRSIFTAYTLLEEEYKNRTKLVFAGLGSDQDVIELTNLIEVNNLKERVKYLGHVDNAGSSLIPNLNLVVLPSKSEGLPMTLIESLGNGIPILATEVGGIPELLNDGYNGYFIKRNPKDIANKLRMILDNKELYRKFSENSYMTYSAKFTNEHMNKHYETMYNSFYANYKKYTLS